MIKTREEVYNKLMKDRDSCGVIGKLVTDFMCDGLLATTTEEFNRCPKRLVLPTIHNMRNKK